MTLIPYLYWPALFGLVVFAATHVWGLTLGRSRRYVHDVLDMFAVLADLFLIGLSVWFIVSLLNGSNVVTTTLCGVLMLVLAVLGEIFDLRQTPKLYHDPMPLWYQRKPSVRLLKWWHEKRLHSA